MGTSVGTVARSVAAGYDAHQHGAAHASSGARVSVTISVPVDHRGARTRHPHAVALNAAVEIAAVLVLLVEGPERVEEGSRRVGRARATR
jgi:hypothetical protein